MSTLTAQDWTEVSALFDALVDLPADERAARLAPLRDTRPALAQRLADMLAADEADAGVLERPLDALAPELHARLGGDDWETRAGEMIGRYRLLSPVGSGGMGEVWLAERADGEYSQRVALKLLKRGMDTQAILRRFLQERAILARLSHPGIVRLLDGGMAADGRPYYVMEHVDGLPVTQYATTHALGIDRRVALLAGIAEIVGYAHAQLVVHRDIKPSNVLVDGEGKPHLLDFGIAKLLEETAGDTQMTGTGVRVLSPAYAAPEQIRGEPVGTATDVFALGVLLHELLTGQLPHQRNSRDPAVLAGDLTQQTAGRPSQVIARSSPEALAAQFGGSVDRRRLARRVAGDLDVIVAKALHAEPARRYVTCAAFADDLHRWIAGKPIAARRDSTRYRAGKFVRRHRLGVAAALAVVLALVAGLGAALWQAQVAREQAQRAERQVARTERVKTFLIDLFRQNDPSAARGDVLTGPQMLERGQANLASAMQDDPETQGELLVAIGEIQLALRDYPKALADVERGIALLAPAVAPDDPRLGQAHLLRGRVVDFLDRPQEAEADLRRARAIFAADPARFADEIDSVDQELASVLRNTANAAAALALMHEVVERSAARLGPGHPAVLERRTLRAVLREEAGDYAGAEVDFRESLPALESSRPSPDPLVARVHFAFAGLLDRIGKRDEAVGYFDQALSAQRRLYGEDSSPYGMTVFSRGILQLGLRRYAQAEADFRAALACFDGEGTQAAHAWRYLGQALVGQVRHDEAIDAYRRAGRLYRRIALPGSVEHWRVDVDLGHVLARVGRIDEGAALLQSGLDGLSGAVAADDIRLVRALVQMGEVERMRGDFDRAIALHERARAIAELRVGARSPNWMWASDQLALDLVARGQPGDLERARALASGVVAWARAEQPALLGDYAKTLDLIEAASAHGTRTATAH